MGVGWSCRQPPGATAAAQQAERGRAGSVRSCSRDRRAGRGNVTGSVHLLVAKGGPRRAPHLHRLGAACPPSLQPDPRGSCSPLDRRAASSPSVGCFLHRTGSTSAGIVSRPPLVLVALLSRTDATCVHRPAGLFNYFFYPGVLATFFLSFRSLP